MRVREGGRREVREREIGREGGEGGREGRKRGRERRKKGRENTDIGGSEFLLIIHILHRDLPILHKAVALHLSGEQQLIQQLLVGTCQELVEDVVAPLSRLL